MSAIAGLLCFDRHAIDAEPAERMAAALNWRRGGGAEDGSYRSPDGRAALAATGLPLANETHDIWLVLDGEILNHRTLRHTLELLGHRFRTRSDAEVVLHAYEQWELDFPAHLQGAFALALWDDRRDRLVLARDRLGRKPLFVARHRGRLGFASGMGALLAELGLPRRLDPVALGRYLGLGVVPAPATLVAGVAKLAAGEMLVADRGGTPWRRRWRELGAAPARQSLPAERHAGNLRTLLECAVADRLDGNCRLWLTPAATSGAVAAIATRLTGAPLPAVAVGDCPDGAAVAAMRALARVAGLEPVEIHVGADGVAAALPAMIGAMAEPVASPALVPAWFAAAGLSQTRNGAVLAALGAEETLLTHPAYAPFRHGGWSALIRQLARAPRPVPRGVAPSLRPFRYPAAGLLRATLPPERLPPLPEWRGGDSVAVAGLDDLALRVADGVAPGLDGLTQAHGLEARLPFLDDSMVDYALALPGRMRGPAMMRRLLGDLVPGGSLSRTEPALPLANWLAGPLGELVAECVACWPLLDGAAVAALLAAHRAQPVHGDGLWALLVLARWCAALGLDQVAAADGAGELVHSRW